MTIEANQLTAYDAAALEVEKAATILERVNVARFNQADIDRLSEVLLQVRMLRHELFSEAHDAFLRARGFRKDECSGNNTPERVGNCPIHNDLVCPVNRR